MDTILKLTGRQRRDLFTQAAQNTGINELLLEKDFWVCWTLQELFRIPGVGEHLIFKGGTSLSKVFRIIHRFSEDIDVSIDREYLGFGGGHSPEKAVGNKEKQRRIAGLKTACQAKISGELHPQLEAAIQAKLPKGDQWALQPDDSDPDGQTLLFAYPTCFNPNPTAYIPQTVKIELGARADHWPARKGTVTPYIAEQFPQGFKEPACTVKVLSAERTFWEKATILHAEFNRPAEKPVPDRFSRHYYDVCQLIQGAIADSAGRDLSLLRTVTGHKALFFRSSWARYEEAAKGTLHLYPHESRISDLQHDYGKMEQMFFGKRLDFDFILQTIRAWEQKFNAS